MTTMITEYRTTQEIEAAAAEQFPASNPNHAYHRAQFVQRVIERHERMAYAMEDRRTIRPRFIAALDERRTYTRGKADAASFAASEARRIDGLGYNWVPESDDKSVAAVLTRQARYATNEANDAANMLAQATAPGTELHRLIGLAEQGNIIDPQMLLATVPDKFGRISLFVVGITRLGGQGQSFTSRNYRLLGAVRAVETARERGDKAEVFFDTCG